MSTITTKTITAATITTKQTVMNFDKITHTGTLCMGAIPLGQGDTPPTELIRGRCPHCFGSLVANLYWGEESGYRLLYQCWEGLREWTVCTYSISP